MDEMIWFESQIDRDWDGEGDDPTALEAEYRSRYADTSVEELPDSGLDDLPF